MGPSQEERVRIRNHEDVPKHLRGRTGSVQEVFQGALGRIYTVRLDAPTKGEVLAYAITEDWLDVNVD